MVRRVVFRGVWIKGREGDRGISLKSVALSLLACS